MINKKLIQQLITCKKRTIKADRRKMILNNRHLLNKVFLTSMHSEFDFMMFMRISNEMIENFSVGLTWINTAKYLEKQKDIILLRCQGPHDFKKPFGFDFHHSYHTHEITVEDIKEKRFIKPSNKLITDAFSSFDTALKYFIKKCNIIDIEDFIDIPGSNEIEGQFSLFEVE